MKPLIPLSHEIYSVSQFNSEVRILLDETFRFIWITGEISNLSEPSSGHCYFSLKDERAQIRCALFRNTKSRLPYKLENGQQVLVQAQASLYEPRGDFQLIVQHIEPAGSGALQIAFEKLKQRLAAEGLFDAVHKKPLPLIPQRIGIITSPTGAAIRDILTVLKRRFPSVPLLIYPTAVQGAQAASQIENAIQLANQHRFCDVLIVARGGGSLEDLWPFNEERVARAIFHSEIVIVSGVGHEVDFTIADFVADLRAATPSAAAECVVPDQTEWRHRLTQLKLRLAKTMQQELKHQQLHLEHLQKRLRHPQILLQDQMQKIDQLEINLLRIFTHNLRNKCHLLERVIAQFHHQTPIKNIQIYFVALKNLSEQLMNSMQRILQQHQQQLQTLAGSIQIVSPLHTLERGYAILTQKDRHAVIRTTHQLKIGDSILARLADGELECTVTEILLHKPLSRS